MMLDSVRQAIHREAERTYGLAPGLLDAVVGQESGSSADLDLLGPMTRHGQAKGPFQIMEKFWGPIPDTYKGQAELSAAILAKGGSTPEEQLASYYGRGQALAGHPTTEQYVNQTMQRIPVTPDMGAPDVFGGTTMPISVPIANPQMGMPMLPMPPMPQPVEMSPAQQLFSNPLLAAGIGMLGTATSGGSLAEALTAGMLGGYGSAAAMQRMRERQADRDYRYNQALYNREMDLFNLQREQAQAQQQREAAMGLAENKQERQIAAVDPQGFIEAKTGQMFAQEEPEEPVTLTGPGGQKFSAVRNPQGGYDLITPSGGWPEAGADLDTKETIEKEMASEKVYREITSAPRFVLDQWEGVREYDPVDMNQQQDNALIVAYAKSLLPKEAVMADDKETVKSAGEQFPWFRGLADAFLKRKSLSTKQRVNILNEVRDRAVRANKSLIDLWQRHYHRAEQRGLEPTAVVPPTPEVPYIQTEPFEVSFDNPKEGEDIGGGFVFGGL